MTRHTASRFDGQAHLGIFTHSQTNNLFLFHGTPSFHAYMKGHELREKVLLIQSEHFFPQTEETMFGST